jgi:hypothetical protein
VSLQGPSGQPQQREMSPARAHAWTAIISRLFWGLDGAYEHSSCFQSVSWWAWRRDGSKGRPTIDGWINHRSIQMVHGRSNWPLHLIVGSKAIDVKGCVDGWMRMYMAQYYFLQEHTMIQLPLLYSCKRWISLTILGLLAVDCSGSRRLFFEWSACGKHLCVHCKHFFCIIQWCAALLRIREKKY